MSLIEAIILGLIQGLTEFIPISSTAHLRVIPALLGWSDPGAAFTAVVQIGTLVAVLSYFYQDINTIGKETFAAIISKKPLRSIEARMGWMIVVGTIPIVVVGLLFKSYIETTFRVLYVPGISLIFFSIILWRADRKASKYYQRGYDLKAIDEITWLDAIKIGFWQVLALVPGASRSGVTITGALFLGYSREVAARYSFLLSIPSVFAAGIYQLIKTRDELFKASQDVVAIVTATFVAGIVGYFSIAFLLGYLKKNSVNIFVGYRIALGVIIIMLAWMGIIS